jgi:hypothetical protein
MLSEPTRIKTHSRMWIRQRAVTAARSGGSWVAAVKRVMKAWLDDAKYFCNLFIVDLYLDSCSDCNDTGGTSPVD